MPVLSKECKMVDVVAGLKLVREKIVAASAKRAPECQYFEPRLVAVSKVKPPELIVAAYEAGQRHFGENYVNELSEKGDHPDVLEKCKEIRWHFIGHLQRNKVNKVVKIPNLFMVETIDNEKIADALNTAWMHYRMDDASKLKVMVQINTSNEKGKNGCEMSTAPSLVKYVIENCQNLQFVGIMTIGMFGYDLANGPNPDFLALKKCRENVCQTLQLNLPDVELSMGMSNDYEHAVELGSTNVRVGSAIFGERPKKDT